MKIFPPELERREEFKVFMNGKYLEIQKALEKDPITIMKTPHL